MTQKPGTPKRLGFVEIVMGADAEVIKSAYEARVKIDGLLTERAEAYRHIVELETQIEQVVGEPGVFSYPPPPSPVAGWLRLEPQPRRAGVPTPGAAKPAAVKKTAAGREAHDAKSAPAAAESSEN